MVLTICSEVVSGKIPLPISISGTSNLSGQEASRDQFTMHAQTKEHNSQPEFVDPERRFRVCCDYLAMNTWQNLSCNLSG